MPTRRILLAATAAATLLSSCATDPQTGQQHVTNAGAGAAIGAVSGALLGAVLGGRHSRGETVLGAGIGAVAGAGIGTYMDNQERDLRARTAGTGVDVVRQGQNIDIRMASGITFDFNASTVKPQFRTTLDQVARTLATYQSTYVDITGYTDSVGTDAVNQRLSEERAFAVADYLGRAGVNRARIATKGYGKAMPIASNADEAGRARNRRVEIHISPIVDDDIRGRRY